MIRKIKENLHILIPVFLMTLLGFSFWYFVLKDYAEVTVSLVDVNYEKIQNTSGFTIELSSPNNSRRHAFSPRMTLLGHIDKGKYDVKVWFTESSKNFNFGENYPRPEFGLMWEGSVVVDNKKQNIVIQLNNVSQEFVTTIKIAGKEETLPHQTYQKRRKTVIQRISER